LQKEERLPKSERESPEPSPDPAHLAPEWNLMPRHSAANSKTIIEASYVVESEAADTDYSKPSRFPSSDPAPMVSPGVPTPSPPGVKKQELSVVTSSAGSDDPVNESSRSQVTGRKARVE